MYAVLALSAKSNIYLTLLNQISDSFLLTNFYKLRSSDLYEKKCKNYFERNINFIKCQNYNYKKNKSGDSK